MATIAKKGAKKPAAPNPMADPVLKARYDDELTRFNSARSGEMAGWDEMYEALDAILYSDPPLYLAGSIKSARAFLSEHLPGVTEATARGNIRVARSFDPDDEKQYGVSKLGLLLDYLEASGGARLEPGIKINPDRSVVRVRNGKSTRKVKFKDLSYDELRAAVRGAKGSTSKDHSTDPPAVKTIRAALRAAHLGQVGVRLRADKVDLTGVPLADLPSLGRTLTKIRIK
jgi:hypothetical protein